MIPKFTPASACAFQPPVFIKDKEGLRDRKEVEMVVSPDTGASQTIRFQAIAELSHYIIGVSNKHLMALSMKIPEKPVLYVLKEENALEAIFLTCGISVPVMPADFMTPSSV
jgi:hypothetical protein